MKTKPIGVRFDENILEKLKEIGYASPQKALNFLESFWVANISKVIEANNLPHHKKEIEEKRTEIKIRDFTQPQPKTNFSINTMPKGLSISEQIQWKIDNP